MLPIENVATVLIFIMSCHRQNRDWDETVVNAPPTKERNFVLIIAGAGRTRKSMRDGSLTVEQVAQIVKLARRKMPPSEIASTLGLSNNIVRVRLCRMRKSGKLELPKSEPHTPLTDVQVMKFFKKHQHKSIAQIHRDTGHARDYIVRLMDRWVRLT